MPATTPDSVEKVSPVDPGRMKMKERGSSAVQPFGHDDKEEADPASCAYDAAGCWSRLWVLHVVPLMRLATRRTVTAKHVAPVPKCDAAEECEGRLLSAWAVRRDAIQSSDYIAALDRIVKADPGRKLVKDPEQAWKDLRKRISDGEFKDWTTHDDFHTEVKRIAKAAYKAYDPGCPLCAIAEFTKSDMCPIPLGQPKIKELPPMSDKHVEVGPILNKIIDESRAVYPNLISLTCRVFRSSLFFGALFGSTQGASVFAGVWLIPEMTEILMVFDDANVSFTNTTTGNLTNIFIPAAEPAPEWKGYMWAGVIFGCTLVMAFTQLAQYTYCLHLSMQIRSSLGAVLHTKALKLSNIGWTTAGGHGKIYNLLNGDVDTIFQQAYGMSGMLFYIPAQMVFAIGYLFYLMSWTTAVGCLVMFVVFPYNYQMGNRMITFFISRMGVADGRVKKQNEMIENIRGVKYFCWEEEALGEITVEREKELRAVQGLMNVMSKFFLSAGMGPSVFQGLILVTYALWNEEDLSIEKIFQCVSLSMILAMSFAILPMFYSQYLTAAAAFMRIGDFLMKHECVPMAGDPGAATATDRRVECRDATFRWTPTESPATLQGVSVRAAPGELVMVVGRVGCGKTSLLEGLLGEMSCGGGWVHTGGTLAYCPQTPWVFNATLQENVLWRRPLDAEKYARIVDKVCLRPDLAVLTHGDQTEIGEKGINLSGGQKVRVSLARALYAAADIYLLDDVLSAVDAHVGKTIFDGVICGEMQGATRILCTNQLQYLQQADRVYVISDHGAQEVDPVAAEAALPSTAPADRSPLQELLAEFHSRRESIVDTSSCAGAVLAAAVAAEKAAARLMTAAARAQLQPPRTSTTRQGGAKGDVMAEASLPTSPDAVVEVADDGDGAVGEGRDSGLRKDSKVLIQDEEMDEGDVSWRTYWYYMKYFGGVWWWALLLSGHLIFNVLTRFMGIWLGWYVDEGREQSVGWYKGYIITGDQHTGMWLGVYCAMLVLTALTQYFNAWLYTRKAVRPCRAMAHDHCKAIFACPTMFFDVTPSGRIITRFTADWMAIDFQVPMTLMMTITMWAMLIFSIIFIGICLPWFFLSVPVILGCYWWVVRLDKASLQFRRIFNSTKAPVADVFAATLHGLSTIRASRRQRDVISAEYEALDLNNGAFTTSRFAFEWVRLRVSILSAFVVGAAFVFVTVFRKDLTPATVSLLVSQCVMVVMTVGQAFLMRLELDMAMNSVERIAQHLRLPPEETDEMRAAAHPPPDVWPTKGAIELRNLSVRYRPSLPLALRDVSFRVEPGWRVGVCGRTGGGKSTLLKAMFRLMHPERGAAGAPFEFLIDGVPAHRVSLAALRGAFAMIPQEPVVFSGTVRRNVDPFKRLEGERQLWDAVTACHLGDHLRRRVATHGGVRWAVPSAAAGITLDDGLRIKAADLPAMRLCDGVMRGREGFDARHGDAAAAKWDDAAATEKTLGKEVADADGPTKASPGLFVVEVDGTPVASKADAEQRIASASGEAVVAVGPNPLDTVVADDTLSVGQRQLLCLARALVLRRRILLLDEATASVDVVTDALIQQTLTTEFKGVTQISIAHRLHTIVNADRILVMAPHADGSAGGRVAQFGSYDELVVQRGGPFYRLAKEAGLAQ